ncbi:hypothetical protein D3C72_1263040 [compost metagenome]
MGAARVGEALGVGIVAPAVEVDRHVVRLRAVADVVGQHADVAQDQGLAAFAVGAVPGLLAGVALTALGGGQDTPVGEIAAQVLIGVHQGVGQIADLVDLDARLHQGRVEVRFEPRQGVDVRAAGRHRMAVVVKVDEVGRVALAVMRLAGALPAIRLARQFADVGDRGRGPQEGRQVVAQGPHGRDADQAVAGIAPGVDLNGGGRDQHQGGGGDHQAFDLTLHRGTPAGKFVRKRPLIPFPAPPPAVAHTAWPRDHAAVILNQIADFLRNKVLHYQT